MVLDFSAGIYVGLVMGMGPAGVKKYELKLRNLSSFNPTRRKEIRKCGFRNGIFASLEKLSPACAILALPFCIRRA